MIDAERTAEQRVSVTTTSDELQARSEVVMPPPFPSVPLKHRVVFAAFRFAASVAGLIGRLRGTARRRAGVLIYPPAGPGSVGDEAMISGLAEAIQTAGAGPVTLLARRGEMAWPLFPAIDRYEPEDASPLRAFVQLFRQIQRHRHLFVVGADCIDGHYAVQNSVRLIVATDAGARLGAVSTLVGSSYKVGAHKDTMRALTHAHPRARLCARDAVSQQRMAEASGRAPKLVADAAFMVEPTALPDRLAPLVEWIDRQHRAGRIVLGINFNHQVFPPMTESAFIRRLFDAYVQMIRSIVVSRPDVSVLLVPHDYRGALTDHSHALELLELLKPELGDRLEMLEGRRLPGEISAVVERIDAVLTGRMHCAILSLNRGVPVACVRYQGKFVGLFQHFGLDGLYLTPEEASDPARLEELVLNLLDRREEIAAKVRSGLPRIRAMSRLNLPEDIRSKLPALDG